MLRQRYHSLALVAVYAVALLAAAYLRVAIIDKDITNPYPVLFETDAARYYREIELIGREYPSLPMLDAYANFPWGMKAQRPPLWSFAEASLGVAVNRLAGVPVPTGAAFFPVIAGLIMAVPAYAAGKRLHGRAAGHLAAMLALFLPVTTRSSMVGMVDHHIADLLLYMSVLALVLVVQGWFVEGNVKKAMTWSALCGALIAYTLIISLSSVMLVVLLMLAIALGTIVLPHGERDACAIAGVFILGSAAAIVFTLYLATPWFAAGLTFSGLSLLHPLILASAAGASCLAKIINAKAKRAHLVAFFWITIIAAALLLPGLGELIIKGFYRSIGSYPLGRQTIELTPLFMGGLNWAVMFFSWLLVVSPLGAAVVAYGAAKDKCIDFKFLLFLSWFLFAGAYAIAARYYIYLFAPAFILSIAILLSEAAKRAGALDDTKKDGLAVALVVSIYLFASVQAVLKSYKPDEELVRMSKWMKGNTPAALSKNGELEYGILTESGVGELVGLLSERPIIATGNHETGIKGIVLASKIFATESEDEAVGLMREHKLRYVLLQGAVKPWTGEIERLGEAGPNPERIAYLTTPVTDEEISKLSTVRLYSYRGGGAPGVEPMERFRLVKVIGGTESVMLFELVEGLRVEIADLSGTEVTISTIVRPEGLEPFEWKVSKNVGPSGKVIVTLPYSTVGIGADDVLASVYTVAIGGKRTTIDVPEQDILEGKTVHLSKSSQ